MLGSVLLFLNIGTPELILIMFVALLLFGGDKLPGLARGLGKGIRDFKDASEGVKREINNQINSYEDKKASSEITPHTEVEEHETTDHDAESRPLIDTSPVAGTAALGDSPVVEHHPATDGEPASHTGGGINLTKSDEPVKTTHE
jgi:sec-independent protein translocase protein TatA